MARATKYAEFPITDFVTGEVHARLSSDEFRTLLQAKRSAEAELGGLRERVEAGGDVDPVLYHRAFDAYKVAVMHLEAFKDATSRALGEAMTPERDLPIPEGLMCLGEAEPGSAEWLKMRQGTLGGSDVGAICQVGVYGESNRDQVRAMKTATEIVDQDHSGAALRGDLWEPHLILMLSKILGSPVYTNKGTYSDGERSVNLDGFLLVEDGQVVAIGESKTSAHPEEWVDGVPDGYVLQTQHYLDIFNAPIGYIVANVDDETIVVYEITPDIAVSAGPTTPKMLGSEFTYRDVLPYCVETITRWRRTRDQGGAFTSKRRCLRPDSIPATWGAAFERGIVAVDLETTTLSAHTGHIIEVAMIRLNADGTRDVFHRFYGLPEAHLAWNGTGAEHVHHISPADIAGMPVLLGNAALVAEMQDFIGDGVLVAHNAIFEETWLTHAGLKADYADSRTAFGALVTDPDLPDNTMRSLVEWAGGEYHDAHRALSDTEMLTTALERLVPVVEAHLQEQAAA